MSLLQLFLSLDCFTARWSNPNTCNKNITLAKLRHKSSKNIFGGNTGSNITVATSPLTEISTNIIYFDRVTLLLKQ